MRTSKLVDKFRMIVAFVVVGATLAAAVWLHEYRTPIAYAGGFWGDPNSPGDSTTHPGWADPVAILIAVIGVGVGFTLFRWRGRTQ